MFAHSFLFKNRPRAGGALPGLAAIAAFLLVGVSCQSTKNSKGPEPVGKKVQMTELRQVVQTQIADPTRSAALLNMTSQAETELGSLNVDYAKRSEKFGKLSADHGKTAADLNAYLREWDAQAHAQRGRVMNVMMAMKAQTTPVEWPAVSNAFINSVMSGSDRYQSMRMMAN